MNPELEDSEKQELMSNADIGAVEVPIDMTERIIDATRADLVELPNHLRRSIDAVAPGLGSQIYSRGQELSGRLLQQLEESKKRGGAREYGSFNDNTAVNTDLESMTFGEINQMVTALTMLADQLAEQLRGQQGDSKIIDLDALDGGDPRAVAEFEYLFTGKEEFKSGDETEVGAYMLTSVQSQDSKGAGAESRKLELHKIGQVEDAELKEQSEETQDNVEHVDFKRNDPATTYGRQSKDNPGEVSRAG